MKKNNGLFFNIMPFSYLTFTRSVHTLHDFFTVGRQWILSLHHGILCLCVCASDTQPITRAFYQRDTIELFLKHTYATGQFTTNQYPITTSVPDTI